MSDQKKPRRATTEKGISGTRQRFLFISCCWGLFVSNEPHNQPSLNDFFRRRQRHENDDSFFLSCVVAVSEQLIFVCTTGLFERGYCIFQEWCAKGGSDNTSKCRGTRHTRRFAEARCCRLKCSCGIPRLC